MPTAQERALLRAMDLQHRAEVAENKLARIARLVAGPAMYVSSASVRAILSNAPIEATK